MKTWMWIALGAGALLLVGNSGRANTSLEALRTYTNQHSTRNRCNETYTAHEDHERGGVYILVYRNDNPAVVADKLHYNSPTEAQAALGARLVIC